MAWIKNLDQNLNHLADKVKKLTKKRSSTKLSLDTKAEPLPYQFIQVATCSKTDTLPNYISYSSNSIKINNNESVLNQSSRNSNYASYQSLSESEKDEKKRIESLLFDRMMEEGFLVYDGRQQDLVYQQTLYLSLTPRFANY